MARVELRFGHTDEPFSFKIDGHEFGELITAVSINMAGNEEPTILLRMVPEIVDMDANVEAMEVESGAFL